jgi:ferrous iron transport protein B
LVTYEILRNKAETNYPDLVVFIADASNLKRNLLLFTQVADLKVPIVLALNMLDVADRRGIKYDIDKLQEKLKVPVISLNARKKEGIDKLKELLLNDDLRVTTEYFSLQNVNSQLLDDLSKVTDKRNKYAALQYAINASTLISEKAKRLNEIFQFGC